MIRKSKTKFLIFTLSAIFIFLTCFFAIMRFALKNSLEHEIANKLSEIEIFADQDLVSYSHNHFAATISYYNHTNGVFSVITNKSLGFSKGEIMIITENALSRRYPLGSIGNIYYKISFTSGVPQTIVAGDFSAAIYVYRQNINNLLITMFITFIVLGILTWLFSFWVFQPINETLFKQRQFISDVSHELKTPVTIISANADVIKNYECNEYVDNIKTQSDRMSVLVNDLLILSRLDENSVSKKRENFSASEAVLRITLPFDAVAFEKGKFLKFDIDEQITATGSREDFCKICEILVDNAVKYSSKDTEIVISLKKESSKIILSVFNKGCNVCIEDKDRIFERFYRADESRARDLGGSGLGLSIAKSLSKKNRWKISASPIYGESMLIQLIM